MYVQNTLFFWGGGIFKRITNLKYSVGKKETVQVLSVLETYIT